MSAEGLTIVAVVEDVQVLQVLRGFNPWWSTGTVPGDLLRPFPRIPFHEAIRLLARRDLRRAVILSGARRVGKTTILYQVADRYLKQGWPPERILYVSFDHPILKLVSLESLVEIFQVNVAAGSPEVLLLLDEIHYASDWAAWLKILVDQHPGYRIVATGSASARLQVEGAESGAGRWTDVQVPPLSFYEYLQLRNLPVPPMPKGLDLAAVAALPAPEAQALVTRAQAVEPHLPRYLLAGGFPETALAEDLTLAQRLMREDIVDRVLKRDMTALYGIRNVLDLERLFAYLCLHTGEILSMDTVAKELGVSRTKVATDIVSLEMAHLVHRSNPVDTHGKRALKPRPKVYMADPALRNAVLLRGDEVLAEAAEMGLILETAVFVHTKGHYRAEGAEVGYWRESASGAEVDVVVVRPDGVRLAAEVKYRQQPGMVPSSGLARFLARQPRVPGFVVTKRAEDFGPVDLGLPGVTLFQVPAFLFLYLIGWMAAERAGAV